MAVNTRKFIRSMLRGELHEPAQKKFTNIELDNIINLAQLDVYKKLLKINKRWLETSVGLTNGSGSAKYITFSIDSTVGEIIAVVDADGNPLTDTESSDIGRLLSDTMFTPEAGAGYYVHIGTSLLIFPASITSGTLYFVQKPAELTLDTSTTIIPDEYISHIIAYGEWKCAAKAGLNEQQKEKAYDEMFVELELRHRQDVEKKTPGE